MRWIWAAIGILLSVNANAVQSMLQKIQSRGELIVAMHEEDTAPFFFKDSNKNFVGIDVDLANEMGKRLNVKVTYLRKVPSFSGTLDLVTQQKADVAVSAIYPTLERGTQFLFSDFYWKTTPVILAERVITAQGNRFKPILKVLNAPSVTVGMRKTNPYFQRYKNQLPLAKILVYETREALIEAVKEKQIQAAFIDDLELKKWKVLFPRLDLYYKIIFEKERALPIAFAVRWQEQHFVSWLNLFLSEIKNDGTLETILSKYSDQVANDN